MNGKANLEVRPTFVNKGEIAKRLVNAFGTGKAGPELVLCLGDDQTDEGNLSDNQDLKMPLISDLRYVPFSTSRQIAEREHFLCYCRS